MVGDHQGHVQATQFADTDCIVQSMPKRNIATVLLDRGKEGHRGGTRLGERFRGVGNRGEIL